MDMKNSKYSVQPCVKNKRLSRYFLPEYLAKHYWWAYLSPIGMKIFDHPFMVNRILWGQYHKIAADTTALVAKKEQANAQHNVAGISCAYGEFYPLLVAEKNIAKITVFDVAPIQVKKMQLKTQFEASKCNFFIGNAEQIAIASGSVDSAVLFFLLHELPQKARQSVIAEAIRITEKGGRIIIADYAPLTLGQVQPHLFHRNRFFRAIFEKMEPFLVNFWRCNLIAELEQQATMQGRTLRVTVERTYWHKFYRLLEFTLD